MNSDPSSVDPDSAENTRRPRSHYLLAALVTALLFGLTTGIAVNFEMSLAFVLLGWAGSHTVRLHHREVIFASASFGIGVLFSFLLPSAVGLFERVVGHHALEIVMASTIALLYGVQGIWRMPVVPFMLGLAAFIASFLAPGWSAAVEILLPGTIGLSAGLFARWTAFHLHSALEGQSREGSAEARNKPPPLYSHPLPHN